MNDNEQLDSILDEALSTYRDAEPLAGIEGRVLHRLRMQPGQSRTTWWKWGSVAACVAMLAFAAWLGLRSHGSQTPVARQQTQASNVDIRPETRPPAEIPRKVTNLRARQPKNGIPAQVARTADLPVQVAHLDYNRRESPQLPAPLTVEERQFLALAQAHPDALRSISQEDQPIAIAPLTIQPLPSETNHNGDY
jgi:hypothetical protein